MVKTIKTNLEAIDPALGHLAEFGKITAHAGNHLVAMRQETIFNDGIISAKLKALAATLWSISARCEPCLKFYILKAKALGASETEVGEMLAIASTMGGCVGEMWALKAYHAFKESGTTDDVGCCET